MPVCLVQHHVWGAQCGHTGHVHLLWHPRPHTPCTHAHSCTLIHTHAQKHLPKCTHNALAHAQLRTIVMIACVGGLIVSPLHQASSTDFTWNGQCAVDSCATQNSGDDVLMCWPHTHSACCPAVAATALGLGNSSHQRPAFRSPSNVCSVSHSATPVQVAYQFCCTDVRVSCIPDDMAPCSCALCCVVCCRPDEVRHGVRWPDTAQG